MTLERALMSVTRDVVVGGGSEGADDISRMHLLVKQVAEKE
jgi:hypothetical protein